MSPSTSTDVRYGRRGGRWAQPSRPRPRRDPHTPRCASCTRPVPGWLPADTTAGHPVCCGRLYCRAQLTWTAAQWEGAARMATTRQRLGLPLTPLDRQALTITQKETI